MKNLLKRFGLSGMEILVVLVVIAVIASFAIPTISRTRTRIKVSQTMQLIGQVGILLELYHADFRRYPDTLLSLKALGINVNDIPRDPFSSDPNALFQYFTNEYPYKGSNYAKDQLWGVTSYGPDKKGMIQESTYAKDSKGDVTSVNVTKVFGATSLYTSGFTGMTWKRVNAYNAGISGEKWWKSIDAAKQSNYKSGDLIRTGPVDIRLLKAFEFPPGSGSWRSVESGAPYGY